MGNSLSFKKTKTFLVEFFYFFRIITLPSTVDTSVIFVRPTRCVRHIPAAVAALPDGLLVAVTPYIVQPGRSFSPAIFPAGLSNTVNKAQLATDHPGVVVVPVGVTDCSPDAIVRDFHTTTVGVVGTRQSDVEA